MPLRELEERLVPLSQLVEVDPAVGEVDADAVVMPFERRAFGELLRQRTLGTPRPHDVFRQLDRAPRVSHQCHGSKGSEGRLHGCREGPLTTGPKGDRYRG